MRDHSTAAETRAAALFIAYLDELPLRHWLDAARANRDTSNPSGADAALHAALQSLVSPAAVFETRAGVLAALQRFDSNVGRWLTRGRGATQFLRPETERAALAVLAHQQLSPEQFVELYAGFEPLIPAALLFGSMTPRPRDDIFVFFI